MISVRVFDPAMCFLLVAEPMAQGRRELPGKEATFP